MLHRSGSWGLATHHKGADDFAAHNLIRRLQAVITEIRCKIAGDH